MKKKMCDPFFEVAFVIVVTDDVHEIHLYLSYLCALMMMMLVEFLMMMKKMRIDEYELRYQQVFLSLPF